ncbi:hypothetical protein BDZ85DRAFT_131 [Elsinoe ampelina]|uniref:Uncharacterized protein n=1 Tax=Elsinoe ampelina TaxID=302913 RepID=A0A6A6GN58_9PEZI|nr:hypothetical protein BDZ85DRAFT_131 [Elsinoe ampelina]
MPFEPASVHQTGFQSNDVVEDHHDRIQHRRPFTGDFQDFLGSIEVIYTDDSDQPFGTIKEINGESADLNKGMGGDCVWLKGHYSTSPGEMVHEIGIEMRDKGQHGVDNISKGAEGSPRFLDLKRDVNKNEFIRTYGLWRTSREQGYPPSGWSGISNDINTGRGGDCLYIVWRFREYKSGA